ncbi:MAG: hypothetical protein HY755_00375 [Nitrospirae bacterium]|nr:hypothetical protein [Nitrospirota bacterium]
MDIKHDLKSIIHGQLEKASSPIFLKRVLTVIEDASDDQKSLLEAAEKISKMVALFIDKNLANTISEALKAKINKIV